MPKKLSGWMPEGQEVFHWPEFQALAKRLGIPLDLPTTSLTIVLEHEKLVQITHITYGEDLQEVPKTDNRPAVDTTTFHNEYFRTKQPPAESK